MLSTSPFMNPPMNALEVKEELLRELEDKKKEGKHREWFEKQALRWLTHKDSDRTLTAIASCLIENPVEDYTDTDFAELAISDNLRRNRIKNLYRLSRDIAKRKFVLDRNLPQVKKLFFWESADSEAYAAEALLLSEVLSLTGQPDAMSVENLFSWEKQLLQQPNIQSVSSCIRSGFFVPEKAEDYLEYIFSKGAKELTPLFVSFKFKNKMQEENPCTP